MFGVPLALAVERSRCHDGIKLPVVVRECIDYIEENGLKVEGIYRLDSWVVLKKIILARSVLTSNNLINHGLKKIHVYCLLFV